jgi:hypothetical protein
MDIVFLCRWNDDSHTQEACCHTSQLELSRYFLQHTAQLSFSPLLYLGHVKFGDSTFRFFCFGEDQTQSFIRKNWFEWLLKFMVWI